VPGLDARRSDAWHAQENRSTPIVACSCNPEQLCPGWMLVAATRGMRKRNGPRPLSPAVATLSSCARARCSSQRLIVCQRVWVEKFCQFDGLGYRIIFFLLNVFFVDLFVLEIFICRDQEQYRKFFFMQQSFQSQVVFCFMAL
jgi:hypothetical protein